MTLSYQGSLSLGQCLPLALTMNAQLGTSIGAARDDIQARITGLLALQLQPPPSLPQLIAGAQQTLLALQGMLANPLPDLGATAAALAELQASLAGLVGSIAFQASFANTLSSAGIRFYAYAGQADELAGELDGALVGGLPGGAGPAESVAGFLLLANEPGAIAALRAVFGG